MAPNYLLHVSLVNVDAPHVVRILSVPPDTNFAVLHKALQIAFGWSHAHLHKFELGEPGKERGLLNMNKIYLVIEDDNEDDDDANDLALPDGAEHVNQKDITLKDIFENPDRKDKDLHYDYDFGDNWEHKIELLGDARKDTGGKIVCVAGEGHYVAEDAGGYTGWEELKEAYAVPLDVDAEQDMSRRIWYEETCANGEKAGLDIWKWDREGINKDLAAL